MRQYLVFGIFMYICQRKKTTSTEIAEYFEISSRTVYRYIDALSYVGVPVICTQGRNGGISIMEGFKLDNLCFTKEEKSIIINALTKEKAKGLAVENIIKSLA